MESQSMGSNEDETFKRLTASREIIFRRIDERHGRVANTAGDAVLAEFGSATSAVAAAVEIQRSIAELNRGAPEGEQMWFRIGINLGDVIERGGDLFGDGVNIAARLQSLADPGGICLSSSVYEQARRSPGVRFADLGQQSVKNIAEPIRVFKVVTGISPPGRDSGKAAAGALPLSPGRFVVAVLPLDNLSEDASQSYFSDGLTEDLITGLTSRMKSSMGS
jgi:adenylate cyclase